MDRYCTHLVTSSAAPCREQLLYELTVGVAVGGVEHAHDLVHQDDHMLRGLLLCVSSSDSSEVGNDGVAVRASYRSPGGFPYLQFRLIRLERA